MRVLPRHYTAGEIIHFFKAPPGQCSTNAARAISAAAVHNNRFIPILIQFASTLGKAAQRYVDSIVECAIADFALLAHIDKHRILVIDQVDRGGWGEVREFLCQSPELGEQDQAEQGDK